MRLNGFSGVVTPLMRLGTFFHDWNAGRRRARTGVEVGGFSLRQIVEIELGESRDVAQLTYAHFQALVDKSLKIAQDERMAGVPKELLTEVVSHCLDRREDFLARAYAGGLAPIQRHVSSAHYYDTYARMCVRELDRRNGR